MEHGHETQLLLRNRKDKFRGRQRALFLLQLCPSFLPLLSLMTRGRTWAPAQGGFCLPGAKPGSPQPGDPGTSPTLAPWLLGKDVEGFSEP